MTVPSVTTNTPITTAWGNSVATDVNLLANAGRGVLAYEQIITAQGSITGAVVDLAGLSVIATVAASRRIRISGYCVAYSTVGSDSAELGIKEGNTALNGAVTLLSPTAVRYSSLYATVVLTPSAGNHTYKLTGVRTYGTGTLTMAGSNVGPAYILVEDIGPA